MESKPGIAREKVIGAIGPATAEVFSTMLGLEIAAEEVLREEAAAPQSGLLALIGLAGTWSGTGSVSCSAKFACVMASALLDYGCDEVNEEVLDAVGEITNMIIGNVKTALEQETGEMGLSTPTVILGRNFQTRSARIQEWTVVGFRCGDEIFHVQLCLAANDAAPRARPRPGFSIAQIPAV